MQNGHNVHSQYKEIFKIFISTKVCLKDIICQLLWKTKYVSSKSYIPFPLSAITVYISPGLGQRTIADLMFRASLLYKRAVDAMFLSYN